MRDYGIVSTSFWTNPDMQQVSEQARHLALYLLTSPHTNALGCFRLPAGYLCADLGWVNGTVSERFTELSVIRFVELDQNLGWVLMPTFLKWNPIQNPNQGKAVAHLVGQVPTKSILIPSLVKVLDTYAGKHFDRKVINRLRSYINEGGNSSGGAEEAPASTLAPTVPETVSERVRVIQEQEQEQEQEENILAATQPLQIVSPAYTPEFEEFWKNYPKRPNDSKKAAYQKYRARLRAGVKHEEMAEGAKRYRRYCDATCKTGTEFVKQAETFLGPKDFFRQAWEIVTDNASKTNGSKFVSSPLLGGGI